MCYLADSFKKRNKYRHLRDYYVYPKVLFKTGMCTPTPRTDFTGSGK